MYKCKTLTNGRICGGEVVEKIIQGLPSQFCKNPKCKSYYICRCGIEFGNHGSIIKLTLTNENKSEYDIK